MILAGTQILASHPIITAVPFFVPTFAVLAVVGVIVYRDRRRPHDEEAAADGGTGADGAGAPDAGTGRSDDDGGDSSGADCDTATRAGDDTATGAGDDAVTRGR
ncbi:hypothetical protein ABZ805_23180 [Saccharopolyspora sp. NPDC047091]|uniref:hypothetical protein n=1 Tax=Saccharopolyspora sp. NPDC047091 TaxID=3155924 RepID=UPI0033EB67F6